MEKYPPPRTIADNALKRLKFFGTKNPDLIIPILELIMDIAIRNGACTTVFFKMELKYPILQKYPKTLDAIWDLMALLGDRHDCFFNLSESDNEEREKEDAKGQFGYWNKIANYCTSGVSNLLEEEKKKRKKPVLEEKEAYLMT